MIGIQFATYEALKTSLLNRRRDDFNSLQLKKQQEMEQACCGDINNTANKEKRKNLHFSWTPSVPSWLKRGGDIAAPDAAVSDHETSALREEDDDDDEEEEGEEESGSVTITPLPPPPPPRPSCGVV
jgi:hypothetical protein